MHTKYKQHITYIGCALGIFLAYVWPLEWKARFYVRLFRLQDVFKTDKMSCNTPCIASYSMTINFCSYRKLLERATKSWQSSWIQKEYSFETSTRYGEAQNLERVGQYYKLNILKQNFLRTPWWFNASSIYIGASKNMGK